MSCDEAREALGGYVLGALEPEERAAVEAHLADLSGVRRRACAARRAARDAAPRRGARDPARAARRRGAAARPDRARARPPPPAPPPRAAPPARPRARGRLHDRRPAGRRGRDRARPRDRRRRRERPAAQYDLRLTGDTGASARAELSPERGGTEVHLWVKGLPARLGVGLRGALRARRAGAPAPARSAPMPAARAYVVLTTAARVGEYERIRVVRHEGPDRVSPVVSGEIE